MEIYVDVGIFGRTVTLIILHRKKAVKLLKSCFFLFLVLRYLLTIVGDCFPSRFEIYGLMIGQFQLYANGTFNLVQCLNPVQYMEPFAKNHIKFEPHFTEKYFSIWPYVEFHIGVVGIEL